MNTSTHRLDTIRVLIRSTAAIADRGERASIIAEIDCAKECDSIKPEQRRHLLQFVHIARAFESCLYHMTLHHIGFVDRKDGSLRKYLDRLASNNYKIISTRSSAHCATQFIPKRNDIMHKAGIYPHDEGDLNNMFGIVHSCMVQGM